jgi:hypothetical protein
MQRGETIARSRAANRFVLESRDQLVGRAQPLREVSELLKHVDGQHSIERVELRIVERARLRQWLRWRELELDHRPHARRGLWTADAIVVEHADPRSGRPSQLRVTGGYVTSCTRCARPRCTCSRSSRRSLRSTRTASSTEPPEGRATSPRTRKRAEVRRVREILVQPYLRGSLGK